MSTRSRSILVVDDEPHVVYVVRFKLEQAGFDVTVAHSGQQGFDLALELDPDLVVTDFQMPGCSGLEMAQRLAADDRTKSIPLIMLTARGHRVPLNALARTNVRSLLAKPFSPKNLLEKVQEVLAGGSAIGPGETQAPSEPGASAA